MSDPTTLESTTSSTSSFIQETIAPLEARVKSLEDSLLATIDNAYRTPANTKVAVFLRQHTGWLKDGSIALAALSAAYYLYHSL